MMRHRLRLTLTVAAATLVLTGCLPGTGGYDWNYHPDVPVSGDYCPPTAIACGHVG